MSVPAQVYSAARDGSPVKMLSRHGQDTGLLPTFGQPGCLIAPVAALPHGRATRAVADRPHPVVAYGNHALSAPPPDS